MSEKKKQIIIEAVEAAWGMPFTELVERLNRPSTMMHRFRKHLESKDKEPTSV